MNAMKAFDMRSSASCPSGNMPMATRKAPKVSSTRRPIPSESGNPTIVIGPNAGLSDRDGLTSRRPLVVRDVSIYGQQPDHYRDVEALGYITRALFHRKRFAISVPGFQVIEITARGPTPGPTDDATDVCRYVSLTIALRDLSS